ncbi:hypothetical protein INR49_022231 [Caranx melampygus]|nr:hypothetical protein INR49_022231 [Caranx melampygus]
MTMLHFGLSSALYQGVISVQAALYGRLNSETCSEGRPGDQVTNTNCSQNGTVNIVRRRCDGKRVCEFNTVIVRATDPCFGTYKYVETNFICVPAIRVTACEGSTASLFCDPGQEIVVLGAYYGRSDQTTCCFGRSKSHTQNTLCIHHTSRVAKRYCFYFIPFLM